MARARFPMLRCPRGGGYGAQCSSGVDRGHSARTQWPIIPAAPCLSRYSVDATSYPIGHSVVSSRRPAEIVGVVDALMGCDALSGSPVEAEAMGYCRASLERYGESLSRLRLYARGLGRDRELVPRRGLPCKASREVETWQAVEASRARWRAGGRGQCRRSTDGLPFGFVFDRA